MKNQPELPDLHTIATMKFPPLPVENPGTLEEFGSKRFQKLFDTLLRKGVASMEDEFHAALNDVLNWYDDRVRYDQQQLAKTKAIAKMKEKAYKVVRKKKVVKKKKNK